MLGYAQTLEDQEAKLGTHMKDFKGKPWLHLRLAYTEEITHTCHPSASEITVKLSNPSRGR